MALNGLNSNNLEQLAALKELNVSFSAIIFSHYILAVLPFHAVTV